MVNSVNMNIKWKSLKISNLILNGRGNKMTDYIFYSISLLELSNDKVNNDTLIEMKTFRNMSSKN